MEGIKAEYVYNYGTPWREDEEAKEKTRRDFKPGEFEAIYKSLPTIEMVFKEGFSPLDYMKLVGLTEIIQKQEPDINLEIKALEKVGLDTILRFTLSQDKYLEQAARLIVQLSQERGLHNKLIHVLNEHGLQLTEHVQPTFNIGKIEMNVYTSAGEMKIHGGNIAIGNKAIANYNAHQAEVDKLLAELSKTNQELVEVLANALKVKDQDKVQSTWEQIKAGISTGASAYTIITTLGKLLGLPI